MKNKDVFFQVSYDAIDDIIRELLLPYVHAYRVIIFKGTLGSGKTTFIKKLIRLLGSTELVTSPTFSYMNTYVVGEMTIHHFDLYRLNSSAEFEELGLCDQLAGERLLSLIEWPLVAEVYIDKAFKKNEQLVVEFEYDVFNLDSRLMRFG